MVNRYSARAIWRLRVQQKVGEDYLRGQTSPRRVMMVIAAIAAIHAVLIAGFLTLHFGNGAPMENLVKIRIIPLAKAANAPPQH